MTKYTQSIIYDDEDKAICPLCGKAVNLGRVGLSILTKVHMGSKECDDIIKAKAEKEKEEQKKKDRLAKMKSWFSAPKKKAPVPTTATAPTVIYTQPVSPIIPANTPPPTEHVNAPAPQAPMSTGIQPTALPSAWDELRNISNRLSAPAFGTRSSDFLSEFDTDPGSCDNPELSADELWEEQLNTFLHRAFRWGEEIERAWIEGLRPERLEGLLAFLEYYVHGRGLAWALFEPRVERLLGCIIAGEIYLLYLHQRIAHCRTTLRMHHTRRPYRTHCPKSRRRLPPPTTNSRYCLAPRFPEGVSPHSGYPFAIHDTLNTPWEYHVNNGKMALFARNCERDYAVKGGACRLCAALERNNVSYYGIGGLHELLRLKNRQIEHYRLSSLNQGRKLARKATALGDHRRFLVAVASGKVERVDRIIRLGLRHGRGIRGLLSEHLRAAKGLYRPKDGRSAFPQSQPSETRSASPLSNFLHASPRSKRCRRMSKCRLTGWRMS